MQRPFFSVSSIFVMSFEYSRKRFMINYINPMKNLRIAKKNPSKILKIIDMQPATYRYVSSNEPISMTLRTNPIDIISHSKQHKNIQTNRQSSLRHSPSRSQRVIQVKSIPKNRKARNRSLGSSHQAIKNQGDSSTLLRFRNSHQLRLKQQHSPYIRKTKFRDSQKLLNFHSVSLNEKARRQEKASKQKQSIKNVTKKRSTHLKFQHIEDIQHQNKNLQNSIENAKKFLGQGQYRKSLLLVKNILQNNPNHLQSLYLSALNWYHLQDRVKALLFLEQIFIIKPAYSPECYKMAAVCYSKNLQYNRSLACLANCHKHFPKQAESYDIQGKVLGKVRKWEQASKAYQIGYDLSKNPSFLLNKAACFEQLNQLTLALECYERLLYINSLNLSVGIKKMQLHIKLHQFQEVIEVYQLLTKMMVQAQNKKQMEEFYYMAAYSYYKLHKFSQSLIIIDEGVQEAENTAQFNKLLLMIRIYQRDIYQAFHLVTRLKEDPQLKTLMKFVQGVIQLMRRNYEDGIETLLSIQNEMGFLLQFTIDMSKMKQQKGNQVQDEFHNQIRKLYLMFLGYGYFNTSQFHICRKLASIQKIIGVPEYFQLGFTYNYQMCEGIIRHCDKQFRQAQTHFQKAAKIYDNRLEPPFSLALNCLQIMVNSTNQEDRKNMAARANQYFTLCQKIVGKNNTNTAAGVYYFSSLLHGYLQEWKEALYCIDESIDRSEDHYWRYFYVRGLLLSCVHSFREAINDLSLAIALSGVTRPECYLLRSKCLQIEGQGNEAFKDLQQYISLKPDDPEVHKYAGQLLFENGAFQDALVAFSHQPITLVPENYDIFLTQGKSFFLLGRFKEALDVIQQAQSLKYSQQVEFDIKVTDILQNITRKKKDYPQIQKDLQKTFAKYPKLGKIFKTSDFHILKAICNVFEKSYDYAISSFLLAIQQKTQQLGHLQGEDESGIFENKKDLITFTSQMKYNIVLCKIAKGQRQEAIKIYKQMVVQFDQPFYGDYVSFKKFLKRQSDSYKKDEVFPSRNKLSNFLDKIQLEFQSNNTKQKIVLPLKLCVPFPKVQPPEIFPSFDKNLLIRLSVLNVERKPEAPWVLRQNNSIKFTDKIQTYSRFQLQDSEVQSSSTYQIISIDQSHIDPSQRSRRLKTSELRHAEEGGRLSRMDN